MINLENSNVSSEVLFAKDQTPTQTDGTDKKEKEKKEAQEVAKEPSPNPILIVDSPDLKVNKKYTTTTK